MSAHLSTNLLDSKPLPQSGQLTLIARLAAKDQSAFSELILDHQDPLVNYLSKLSGCRSRAEDLAQEAFIRFYHAVIKNPERDWQIRAYLYRIAVNLFCSQERRHKNFNKLKHLLPGNKPAPQPDSVIRQETQKKVQEALAKVPLKFRAPLILRELEGWRLEDIAICLKVNEGTVKSRIFRGKQRLKVLLKSYWQGERQ